MSWAADEFETIDLGDQRLNRHTVLVAERLAAQPTASIPAACGGWAETQAAYRLLSDDDIGRADILAPHLARTDERMTAHPVVLCIQDTTELDAQICTVLSKVEVSLGNLRQPQKVVTAKYDL